MMTAGIWDEFRELTGWRASWRAKAIKGGYPNWKHIVPERSDKTHFVTFQNEQAGKLQRYLKGVPDNPQNNNGIKLSRLPEVPDTLHLESSNGMLFSIPAEFDPNWDDLSFVVRKEFLLHLLDAEHRKIELNDAFCPIIGTGGTGQYIAMPIRPLKAQSASVQKPEEMPVSTVPVEAHAISNSSESAPEQNPPHKDEKPAIPYTPSTKEKPTMENTVPRIVSAPVQTSAQNNDPAKEQNPLDELLANIEDMKAKIKVMFDESSILVRKVREVAISQRQKEREYQQAKRAIERIRVASGAA